MAVLPVTVAPPVTVNVPVVGVTEMLPVKLTEPTTSNVEFGDETSPIPTFPLLRILIAVLSVPASLTVYQEMIQLLYG